MNTKNHPSLDLVALQLKDLTIQFGGLKALDQLNLSIPKQTIFGLIGPNGAGKTTVFNLITGVYSPTSGSIEILDQNSSGLKPWQVTRLGVARTFQNIRLFKELTVLENMLIAADSCNQFRTFGFFPSIFRTPSVEREEGRKRSKCLSLLEMMHLELKKEEKARNLPYGDQRRLEIARALATGAQVLLLDEPAAGLNPKETQELMNNLRWIRDHSAVTILLIEHDMKLVMGICERVAVLDYGVKIAEGDPTSIQQDSKVIEAYLGKRNACD